MACGFTFRRPSGPALQTQTHAIWETRSRSRLVLYRGSFKAFSRLRGGGGLTLLEEHRQDLATRDKQRQAGRRQAERWEAVLFKGVIQWPDEAGLQQEPRAWLA